jgi:hypothetical protein
VDLRTILARRVRGNQWHSMAIAISDNFMSIQALDGSNHWPS